MAAGRSGCRALTLVTWLIKLIRARVLRGSFPMPRKTLQAIGACKTPIRAASETPCLARLKPR